MSLLHRFKWLAAPALAFTASLLPSDAVADLSGTTVDQQFMTASSLEQLPEKSELIADENGVLWFKQGADRDTAISMAGRMADATDGFVIIFSTNEEYKEQATAHALKLADWFQKDERTPDEIPVVAYMNNRGVGYLYSIDGMPYGHDTHAPEGVMNPAGSVATLDDAALEYSAADFINARDETYDAPRLTEPVEVSSLDRR